MGSQSAEQKGIIYAAGAYTMGNTTNLLEMG